MRALILACSLAAVVAVPLHAADPGPSLAKAREEIAAGRHAAALQLLRETTAHAAALTDTKQRAAALSAIHFYSAVAASGLGDPEQATAELRSFFLYNPSSKLDTSRFSRDFATLFTTVQKKVAQGRSSPASFDDAYPGYPPAVSSSIWPLNIWGASSEFMILGTEAEKEQWGRLRDDEARRAFVDKFWADRDPDPSTGVNELRVELLRRIAFADVAFVEEGDDRGSLTDRGRVFVLLGPPQRVRIRPMTRRESIGGTPSRTLDAGNAVEHWVYFREQLPRKLPHNEVEFKFVSQGGSLVRVLQHEFIPEKVIRDSPAALRRD
ncbi:MAG TPA: GWxTD domain-containing protein [Thermoanaerobaculia bacterium]|jgi:GWxTD domain-containing protein